MARWDCHSILKGSNLYLSKLLRQRQHRVWVCVGKNQVAFVRCRS